MINKNQHVRLTDSETITVIMIDVELNPCCVTCTYHHYGDWPEDTDECRKHSIPLEHSYEQKCRHHEPVTNV